MYFAWAVWYCNVLRVNRDSNSGYFCGGKDADKSVVDDEGYCEPPSDCDLNI